MLISVHPLANTGMSVYLFPRDCITTDHLPNIELGGEGGMLNHFTKQRIPHTLFGKHVPTRGL